MASVSHLPHVLANVLVAQAARVLSAEGERLPATGPSFRDVTRVAGANSVVWGGIYRANADALVAAIDDMVARLTAVRDQLAGGDDAGIREWNDSAREDRRRLLESDLAGGEVHELRVLVPNRPGIVAEIALALGRATIDIVDMGLYPLPARTAPSRCGFAAASSPSRPSGWSATWGWRSHAHERDREPRLRLVVATRRRQAFGRRRASAAARRPPAQQRDRAPPSFAPARRPAERCRVNTRFDPSGPLRGSLRAPGDKSMSHRAALFGAMCDEPDPCHRLPRGGRHLLDAQRRPRVRRAGRGGRRPRHADDPRHRAARRPQRRTSTSATPAR